MSDALTLYKLIVLKLLEQVNGLLSYSQISEFILGKEYTNYFTLQQVFAELTETGLATLSSRQNTSYYRITDAGRETLTWFGGKLSDAILTDIREYLDANRLAIRDALSVTADAYPGSSGDYLARCQVREKDAALIDLTLSVPSRDEAESICRHWQEKSQELYAYLMKELL